MNQLRRAGFQDRGASEEGAKPAEIQYDVLAQGAMWIEFRSRLIRNPAPWKIGSSTIQHWHRDEMHETQFTRRTAQEMVMISQARVIVVGQHTSWPGCGGICSATVIKCEPAYDPANEHLQA